MNKINVKMRKEFVISFLFNGCFEAVKLLSVLK